MFKKVLQLEGRRDVDNESAKMNHPSHVWPYCSRPSRPGPGHAEKLDRAVEARAGRTSLYRNASFVLFLVKSKSVVFSLCSTFKKIEHENVLEPVQSR